MNTSAKIYRSDSAISATTFKPNELGGERPSVQGLQTFQFPTIGAPANSVGSLSGVKSAEASPQNFAFPQLGELPVIDATVINFDDDDDLHSHEKTAVEKAVREQLVQETRATVEAEMAETNARTETLRKNLAESIESISKLAGEISTTLETEAVQLALEIAKKVVAREVSIDREVVISVTKTALSKLHARTLASVHLHRDDLAFVQEHRDKLNFHGSLELIEDNSITPGGCLIHTDAGDVDGRIESQFDEITHALLGDTA